MAARSLEFERGKEALGGSIVPAVSLATHALDGTRAGEHVPEAAGGELAPTVRVKDQAWLRPAGRHCAAKRFSRQVRVELVTEGPADHLAGERSGKVLRIRRGVYRLKHFPPGQQEDLVAIWLWSEHVGVFSHETALLLHDLSDVLPARAHLTVPAAWRDRRLRVPEGVALHYADVRKTERVWFGVVPVTSVPRTLSDCAADHLSPDLLSAAVDQALTRGVVAKRDVAQVQRALQEAGAK